MPNSRLNELIRLDPSQAALYRKQSAAQRQAALNTLQPSYSSPYTNAQLQQVAQSYVNQLLGAQTKAIEAERERARQYALSQQAGISGFSEAASRLLAQLSPQLQGAYTDAGQRTEAFGKGLSDGLRLLQDQSAGQANALLAQQGSPQQVQGDQGAAGVLQGTYGGIPAQALGQESAGYTAAAAQYSNTALGMGLEALRSSQAQAGQVDQDFGQQIVNLAATRPELLQEFLSQIIEGNQKQQAIDIQNAYLTQSQENAGYTGANFYTDAQGRTTPKGYRYNAKGELTKIPGPKAGTKDTAKADAIKEKNTALDDARDIAFSRAKELRKQEEVPNKNYRADRLESPQNRQFFYRRTPWPEVERSLYTELQSRLSRFGVKDAVIQQIVEAALIAAGKPS